MAIWLTSKLLENSLKTELSVTSAATEVPVWDIESPVTPSSDERLVSRSEKFCFNVPKLDIETSNSSVFSVMSASTGALSASTKDQLFLLYLDHFQRLTY